MVNEYTFTLTNDFTPCGITQSIKEFNLNNDMPIIVCIGSDLILGDSLGPLVGTMLKKRKTRAYIYGTLNFPVTAKEIEYARTYIKSMHPNSKIIAIDAGVGNSDEIGLIKVLNKGLYPGLGVNKKLGLIGDISIVGIVAGKSNKNYDLFHLTRLNMVYKMAEKIAQGIEEYINAFPTQKNMQKYVN